MRRINVHQMYRIVDANFNRAKEGLRVCEDIARFVLNKRSYTAAYKRFRHRLTDIISLLKLPQLIKARDVARDVGRPSIRMELKRDEISDIFYANSQRVKESVRVLEEFSKLVDVKASLKLKELRYQLYAVEQKVSSKL